jgi:feruloyl-CoA synthase
MTSIADARFSDVHFAPAAVDVERRADGALVLRSPQPLAAYPRCMGEHLERWARQTPDAVFLAEREKPRNAAGGEAGDWRRLTYAEALAQVRSLGAALLERGLSAERPLAILSDNSIEHALLALAAMHVGVPVAPISPAYSLMSRDFAKLKRIFELLSPGLVFVDDGAKFAPAIAVLERFDFELVTGCNPPSPLARRRAHFADLAATTAGDAVDRAFAAIGPDTVAKFLFTSGSTGEPKAVINTQRMLCSNAQALVQCWPFLEEEAQTLVDWLPWNHTFGGNRNFGSVLRTGATLYIDEGKPAPGLIERTVANLRDVSPTIYYNVPRGFDMLLPYLESDAALRRSFFRRLKLVCYAGAALPASLWQRLERLSVEERGERVRMTAGWGATETAPGVTLVHFELERSGNLGLPEPGCELKMVPIAGYDGRKYELRVRGPNVMPGYWRQPELTRAAFDEEGYYRIGDAGRFTDAADATKGIEFGGRVAEEFKLASGTWVQVGALRVKAIAALAPVAQDIAICGHDRNEIGFLVFPSIAGCRSLAPELAADAPIEALLAHPAVRARLQEGLAQLKRDGGGTSTYATRALLLQEPASIDAGEITDKGYVNQRAVLERRALMVERLYADPLDAEVVRLETEAAR